METKGKRRALGVAMLAGALWVFIRRPSIVLAGSIILYMNSEAWLGIKPLGFFELAERATDATEITLAAAGVLVAMASLMAFKAAKRLDLELAAAADVSVLIRDTGALLVRNRMYCERILRVKELHIESIDAVGKTADQTKAARDRRDVEWSCLLDTVDQVHADRSGVWDLVRRLGDLNNQHGPIIRTRVLMPLMLERAQASLEELGSATVYVIPGKEDDVGRFMGSFFLSGAKDVANYLEVDDRHMLRVLGYLGGASSIGSTAVAPVSLITALRMVAKVWRM